MIVIIIIVQELSFREKVTEYKKGPKIKPNALTI